MKEITGIVAAFLVLNVFPGSFYTGYLFSKYSRVSPFLFFMLTTLICASVYGMLRLAGYSWFGEEGDMLLISMGVIWYGLVVFQSLRGKDTPVWIFTRAICFLPVIPIFLTLGLMYAGFFSMVIRKFC
jgi:hypothetical protein